MLARRLVPEMIRAVHADEGRCPQVMLTRDRALVSALARVFGRAFVTEPMMCWPMGSGGDLAARFTQCFVYFLEMALPLGIVYVAGQADGLAVWTAPEQRKAFQAYHLCVKPDQ